MDARVCAMVPPQHPIPSSPSPGVPPSSSVPVPEGVCWWAVWGGAHITRMPLARVQFN